MQRNYKAILHIRERDDGGEDSTSAEFDLECDVADALENAGIVVDRDTIEIEEEE